MPEALSCRLPVGRSYGSIRPYRARTRAVMGVSYLERTACPSAIYLKLRMTDMSWHYPSPHMAVHVEPANKASQANTVCAAPDGHRSFPSSRRMRHPSRGPEHLKDFTPAKRVIPRLDRVPVSGVMTHAPRKAGLPARRPDYPGRHRCER